MLRNFRQLEDQIGAILATMSQLFVVSRTTPRCDSLTFICSNALATLYFSFTDVRVFALACRALNLTMWDPAVPTSRILVVVIVGPHTSPLKICLPQIYFKAGALDWWVCSKLW